uniref:Uncharacterized protein n=1 Tax=viral metagenome TaxID=1070528 RepID=A0A6C0H623_9ZZZZ
MNYINNEILKNEQIKNNWQYRYFIQNNSIPIMKYNSFDAYSSSGVSPYYHIPTISSKYQSDLKKEYLQKFYYNSNLISPSIKIEMKK